VKVEGVGGATKAGKGEDEGGGGGKRIKERIFLVFKNFLIFLL
jgi:hypothetical protein